MTAHNSLFRFKWSLHGGFFIFIWDFSIWSPMSFVFRNINFPPYMCIEKPTHLSPVVVIYYTYVLCFNEGIDARNSTKTKMDLNMCTIILPKQMSHTYGYEHFMLGPHKYNPQTTKDHYEFSLFSSHYTTSVHMVIFPPPFRTKWWYIHHLFTDEIVESPNCVSAWHHWHYAFHVWQYNPTLSGLESTLYWYLDDISVLFMIWHGKFWEHDIFH